MALARKLSVEGNVARHLPEVERTPRYQPKPAPQPKVRNRGVYVLGALGWICAMAFSLVLIQRNTLVLEGTKEITKAREALTILEQQNQELEVAAVQKESVSAVEDWAISKGMNRPTTVRPLKGDPKALAARPTPTPAATARATEASGFWGSLKGYVARMVSVTPSAGN